MLSQNAPEKVVSHFLMVLRPYHCLEVNQLL
jgi:hypothetical protein